MKHLHRLFAVASAAFLIAGSALAQNAGTVTNHAYALGKGPGVQGYTSLLCTSAQLAVGQAAADPICQTITGDVTISAAGVTAIGATKVTNATLAAMAANTTKCNATAGSAVPTDCTASTMRTNIGTVIGTNVQAWDADLDCLAANSTAGFLAYTGAGTCASRTLTAPAAGFTITNPAGTAGNPTFVLANDLAALEGLSGTGIARRTGTDAWSVGTAVALTEMATQSAFTFVGNNTSGSAAPTAVDIAALTTKASPAAGDYVMLSDQAAAGAWKKATVSSVSSAGSVASFNGLTGAVAYNQYGLTNHSLAVSASAGALTIALKDSSGADASATSPVYGNFRSPTGTTGSWVQRSVTAANSLTIASGATMGVTSATAFRLWVVLFDDAATMRLGVINCSTSSQIFPLNEGVPISSIALSGASNSAGTFYTGTAVTSKSFLIVGYIEWNATGLTAGTWTTTNVNFLQSFGPGVRKPGEPVQLLVSQTSALATGTTIIPSDNTIPQNTEGDQYMSLAITPSSAANRLRITAQGSYSSSIANAWLTQAIFQDSAANALTASVVLQTIATASIVVPASFEVLANTVSSTTFKVRGGTHAAATTSFNGSAGVQLYGGVNNSFLRIEEIMG